MRVDPTFFRAVDAPHPRTSSSQDAVLRNSGQKFAGLSTNGQDVPAAATGAAIEEAAREAANVGAKPGPIGPFGLPVKNEQPPAGHNTSAVRSEESGLEATRSKKAERGVRPLKVFETLPKGRSETQRARDAGERDTRKADEGVASSELIRPFPNVRRTYQGEPSVEERHWDGRDLEAEGIRGHTTKAADAPVTPRLQQEPRRPWGLSGTDSEAANSAEKVHPSAVARPRQREREVDPSPAATPVTAAATEPTEQSAELKKASAASTKPSSGPERDGSMPSAGKKLTHLTAAGEAHMVDVGAKPSSNRVAIATAYVKFSNPEPLRLITENSNKKGDVLSLARVAGIMAAKRTADLIPLCHPIAISKVEVDLELSQTRLGGVAIRTLVGSLGPTGVEMEALTAALGAAMTVYDMCKAVDKNQIVERARVVYKSGGRSGLFVKRAWAELPELKRYLEGKGLELPARKAAERQREDSTGAEVEEDEAREASEDDDDAVVLRDTDEAPPRLPERTVKNSRVEAVETSLRPGTMHTIEKDEAMMADAEVEVPLQRHREAGRSRGATEPGRTEREMSRRAEAGVAPQSRASVRRISHGRPVAPSDGYSIVDTRLAAPSGAWRK